MIILSRIFTLAMDKIFNQAPKKHWEDGYMHGLGVLS